LNLLSSNFRNLWRWLVLSKGIYAWSVSSSQRRMVKTGGRLIKDARHHLLLLAGEYLHRRLFGQMPRRIWAPTMPSR
jgi:hypothetical protein